MKRILLLTLGGIALLIPTLKAQDISIAPGGVRVERHRNYYNSDEWQQRQRQREYWRERRTQQER
jgi:hypothetical protein